MAKILIADSSPKAKEMLHSHLEQESHQVKFLGESDSLETVLSESKYDVIVIDLQYKHIPSLDIVTQIGKDPLNSHTNIIVTTNVANKEVLNKYVSAGVSYVFMKPYRFKVLSDKITKIIEPNSNAHGAFEPLILKIFLESSIHIFEAMTGTVVIAGKPFLKSGNKSLADVSAVIGLSSTSIKGSLSINLNRNILTRFIFKLFGSAVVADEAQINDICGEICNQIMGRAKQQFLKRKNMGFEITVPTVLSDPNHILDYKSASPVLVIPFSFENDEGIFVEFCLEVNDKVFENPPDEKDISNQVVIEEGEFIQF